MGAFPFADDLFFAEDQDWARRVLLAGYGIRYEPAAAVRHSHTYTVTTAFKRFFDTGASAERGFLAGGSGSSRVLRREALRYAREELAWLGGPGGAAGFRTPPSTSWRSSPGSSSARVTGGCRSGSSGAARSTRPTGSQAELERESATL